MKRVLRSLIAVVRALLARTRFERDMRDELRLHIEQRADDLVAGGVAREEAQRRARIEFGAVEAYKEQCRDASGFVAWRPLHGVFADLKLAARRLAATPLFTIFAVVSLAVGLGVTTAAYSVVASLLFTSSGIPEEEELVSVMTAWDGRLVNGGISTADVEDLRAAQQSFASLTAYTLFRPSVATPAGTDLMRAEAVDGAYFQTLGVKPMLGRAIVDADLTSRARVAVVSHALWTRRFGADPALVGRILRTGGESFEVVGVTPKEFRGFGGPFEGTHVWVPVTAVPAHFAAGMAWSDRERPRFMLVGRLSAETPVATASAEVAAIGSSLDASRPKTARYPGPPLRAWSVRPVGEERSGETIARRFGVALIALVALVLVVACTNLANLVLARGVSRQQEFAIRRAIGASRWRLVREHCAESLWLAALGAGAGWMVFTALASALDLDIPLAGKMLITFSPTLDPAVLTVAGIALALSLLVFGLEPAIELTRDRGLRSGLAASAGSVGVPKARRQRALVRWQVAISTGFFVLAALAVRYTVKEARHDSGVDLDRLAVATMNFWAQQWEEPRARRAVERVLEELQQEPAVTSASVATGVPFGSSMTPMYTMSTPDKPLTPGGAFHWGPGIAATSRIFQTLGIEVVRGRGLDDRDHAGSAPVAVISEATALNLFGTLDVVGRQMLIKPRDATQLPRSVARKLALPSRVPVAPLTNAVETVTVVGVVSNTDVGQLFSDRRDAIYLPLAQQAGALPFAIVLVRTNGDPYGAVRSLRDAIGRADPDLAIESSGTGLGTLGGPAVFLRAATGFALGLGGITLLLSMVGLYGVQSHGVERRTREIGVRMSFGATAAQIRGLVLKDGYRPVLQGLALGLFIGFVGRGLARAFLWEKIELVDAWMLLAVPVPMILAAFFACYWPARRASRVDPNVALRHL